MDKDCTLIISTYNWKEALRLTLSSVLCQTVLPNEVIIADDGSDIDTKILINNLIKSFPIPLIHIWHEDIGFRLATIRNKSIAKASGKYIIQVDGDVILHKKFIEDHLLAARPGYLLQGSRVMLGKSISQRLLLGEKKNISAFDANISRRENGFRIKLLSNFLLNRYRNKFPFYYARGANMSFWKQDIIDVNGYNENFEGWGHEDSDLTLRLMNNGIKKSIIKFAAIVYHIFHSENRNDLQEDKNRIILEKTLHSKIVWAPIGINQYLL
ncbi:glycosyltransferase family 2 protein [uncultured Sphingobacterium sp.]|uniref:glycosyltransferase family 2 protein n=1 Tax=uncultured Sphingobacterium sp. TaxID=182688 RepID=UPI0025CE2927|nr:glycosyltransferase family 2 protein [uncultured Sphingobacterium sp.]